MSVVLLMGRSRALVVDPIAPTWIWLSGNRLSATPQSRAFCERLGFVPVDEPEATHSKPLQ
ncbi:hypothetical protein [Hoeflea ulvae]|uniref:Uncharacterized protein n=1 Tax=Hoeflea ulvae TaxID=2983764 RepID=A0ABT3YBQ2_9HYPH|nr:hypothetical protein [Hoeflea ulvae]MCY0093137.1 hypothetical protein [Hoeflea ulvae]